MAIGSRAASRRLNPAAHTIAVVGFMAMLGASLITLIDVFMRWRFNLPIDGWDDLTGLVFAIAILSAFPAGLLQGHNITIRFLGKALGERTTYWLELFGALLTFVFITAIAWQMVVLVFELHESHDTTMTAEIVTWPWWTVAMLTMLYCVPVQAVVLYGQFRRAIEGGGPGGSIDPYDEMSEAQET